MKEAFFYGGTVGYESQYLDLTIKKYEKDRDWLRREKNIDINQVSSFLIHLKKICQKKLNSKPVSKKTTPADITRLFLFHENTLFDNNVSYKNIADNLTITFGESSLISIADIGDFNYLLQKPIVKMGNGKFFIPMPLFIFDALWESPYYWMATDEGYASKAFNNRGDAAEEIVYEQLAGLFGTENVFKNVIIKQGKKTVTDIDILSIVNNKAIVFQIKSKRLTAISKKGDFNAIKNDFKKAVLNAYDQAKISKDAILENEKYSFNYGINKHLKFDEAKYECLVVIVLLDFYPGITPQVHQFFDESFEEKPVVLNVFDLQNIIRYLNTAEKFIDYLERRKKFSHFYYADNELAYLSLHLEFGLVKPSGDKKIVLDRSFGQGLDALYYSGFKSYQEQEKAKDHKIGRNDLCHCGSKKKYKHCHGQ